MIRPQPTDRPAAAETSRTKKRTAVPTAHQQSSKIHISYRYNISSPSTTRLSNNTTAVLPDHSHFRVVFQRKITTTTKLSHKQTHNQKNNTHQFLSPPSPTPCRPLNQLFPYLKILCESKYACTPIRANATYTQEAQGHYASRRCYTSGSVDENNHTCEQDSIPRAPGTLQGIAAGQNMRRKVRTKAVILCLCSNGRRTELPASFSLRSPAYSRAHSTQVCMLTSTRPPRLMKIKKTLIENPL